MNIQHSDLEKMGNVAALLMNYVENESLLAKLSENTLDIVTLTFSSKEGDDESESDEEIEDENEVPEYDDTEEEEYEEDVKHLEVASMPEVAAAIRSAALRKRAQLRIALMKFGVTIADKVN